MKMHTWTHRQAAIHFIALAIVFFITVLLSSSVLWAQYSFYNKNILAPEVSHFTRPNEPGVDAHGDLSLSIPLITVPGRDGLNFDLGAQYRSGIPVAQSASWIGLGWELDIGSITRQPLGGVEDPQGIVTYEQADFAHALPGYGGVIESQADVYSVNMNGNSTLLLAMTRETNPLLPYDPAQNETIGDCFGNIYSFYYFITSPWRPWKFCYNLSNPVTVDGQSTQKHGSGTRYDFTKFIITTEDGTRYVYSGAGDLPTLSHALLPPNRTTSYTFASTWRLRAILAPNYTGPSIPSGTSSKGGWVKIVYKTWDRVTPTTAEWRDTILDGNGRIIAQITYPYYVETPSHFAFFTTSKRYDRDLAVLMDCGGTMCNGQDLNYYSRKLDKITLYKKTEAVGVPMTEPSSGGELDPQFEGTAVMEVSCKYLNNGADVLSAYNDNDPNSPHKKMLSKLALEKISFKGLAGTASDSLPSYKFAYYDSLSLSWLNVTEGLSGPIHNYQDDFGYLEIPPSDPNYGSGPPTRGWMYSLKQITYPEGGRHLIRYTNDSLSALGNLNFNYNQYVLNTSYTQPSGSFERYEQGGARVRFIIKYNGYNDTAPDTTKFIYGPGRYSALSEVWYRKQPLYQSQPFYFSGERGQANVAYDWVHKKFKDGSAIKTYYLTGPNPEFQILYLKSSAEIALLQGNKNWNWGEVTKVEYLANNGKVKEDIYYWQFRGHTGDVSLLKLATVAPGLRYDNGQGLQYTPVIDLNFTHKQLDSVVTKSYFGASTVTSREAYDYNDGTLLERRTETSGENKVRKTETTYMHDIPGLAIADSMKKKNLRAQIAQTSVKDNSNNGYSSVITTWRIVTHNSKNKFMPDKEFRWRNNTTAAAIPTFNWGTPAEGNGWILTQTFDQYDQHGNLTQVKDANGIATTISWDVASGTLIDSIKTRPSSTLKPLTTKYTYDPNTFRLTAITDPNGQKTEYKYDPLQRLIEVSNPDKRTVAQNSYFYSRQAPGSNDNFVTTNPNHVKTILSSHALHVRNHDFEEGTGWLPNYWTVDNFGDGEGTWDNTNAFSGSKSLKADIPAPSSTNRVRWMVYPWYDEKVSPNETYRMEVWVKTANAYNGNARFVLFFRDAQNNYTGRQDLIIPAGDRNWTKFTLDFTPALNQDHVYAIYLDFDSKDPITLLGTYKGTIWYDRANFYELNVTKTFADGLGRDIQSMQREGNGAIKSGTLYDFASRVSKVTKPFNATDTSFVLDPISAANTWYSQTAGNHPAYYFNASSKEFDTDPYAFAEIEYYPDPLNRVKNQYFPGTAFSKLGPDKKYVKQFYTANAANELGFAANKVLETRIIDENLVQSEIFTDTFGNKVGVRVDSSSASGNENTTKLATAFQYDILNNLTKIAPPRAFQIGNNNTPDWASLFCTSLTYNTLSHLTSRQTPDAGTDSMYYDKKGNLRFVKDAKGAAGNYFIYYKYDNLNRKIEEGTMTPVSGNFKPNNADIPTYPSTGNTFKVKFQYDSTTYAASAPQRNLRGRLDAIEYVTDRYPNRKGYLFYSYDNNGNVEWIEQYIPKSDVNDGNGNIVAKIDYEYDAFGKVMKTYFRRTFPPGGATDAFYVWYDYDALGRLERVFTNTIDVKPFTPINAQYTYWPSGQVKRLVLGSTRQGLDYLYNSRDWLTQINSHYLLANKDPGNDSTTVTKDRFGEIIGYNKQKYIASDGDYSGDFDDQFNGNISWLTLNTDWPATNPDTATGLVFKYDKANRLTKGNWGNLSTPTSTNWSATNRYDLTGITYDRNGNLDLMTRRNQTGAATNMGYIYYANTNKLEFITGLGNQDFENYTYDANGNMIKDVDKLGFGTITYDYRNLPAQVPIQSNTINFGYDGKGQRVSKNNLFYVPGADGRVIAVYDDKGTHLYWNIWGLDLIGQRFWKQ